jgi:hypothetical protein
MTTRTQSKDATCPADTATIRPGSTRPGGHSSQISMAFVAQSTGAEEYMRGLFERFRALNAQIVCLRYDGAGGRDVISETVLHDADGRRIFGVPRDLREEFRYICVMLLEMRFFGWQKGAGARGRFAWDVVFDSLTHWHAQRPAEEAPDTDDPVDEDSIPF